MNKEIIVQVAFKGAIECAVNGKAEVNEIRNLTNLFTDIMLDTIGEQKQQSQFKSSNSGSGGGSNPMTQPQKNLLNRLIKENGLELDISNFTVAQASNKIEELIGDTKK
jgi:hypothetical protein